MVCLVSGKRISEVGERFHQKAQVDILANFDQVNE